MKKIVIILLLFFSIPVFSQVIDGEGKEHGTLPSSSSKKSLFDKACDVAFNSFHYIDACFDNESLSKEVCYAPDGEIYFPNLQSSLYEDRLCIQDVLDICNWRDFEFSNLSGQGSTILDTLEGQALYFTDNMLERLENIGTDTTGAVSILPPISPLNMTFESSGKVSVDVDLAVWSGSISYNTLTKDIGVQGCIGSKKIEKLTNKMAALEACAYVGTDDTTVGVTGKFLHFSISESLGFNQVENYFSDQYLKNLEMKGMPLNITEISGMNFLEKVFFTIGTSLGF